MSQLPPITASIFKRGGLLSACLGLLLTAPMFAVDNAKVRVLEKCDHIDPKALRITEAKAKVVSTQDAEHRKVLEMVMDYAKAGQWAGLGKNFPENTNLKKFSAIRFWVRSDSGTGFNFGVSGHYKRKDGRGTSFNGGFFKGTENWTLITIPLEKLKRNGFRYWDKQKQEPVSVPGGDPMEDEDFDGLDSWGLGTTIEWRGTATRGHLQFDGFELIEK